MRHTLKTFGVLPFVSMLFITMAAQDYGDVAGVVSGVDFSGRTAVISKANVVITSARGKQVSLTDATGNFLLKLPVGHYTICFLAEGFRPSCRATFIVRGGTQLRFRALLFAKGYIDSVAKGDDPSSLLAYHEKRVVMPGMDPDMNLLVSYGIHKPHASGTCYESIRLPGNSVSPATLTYDNYTIQAMQICLRHDHSQVVAHGHVSIDDGLAAEGHTIQKSEQLTIVFQHGGPVFKDRAQIGPEE